MTALDSRFRTAPLKDQGIALSEWLIVLVVVLALAGIGIAAMTTVLAKSRLLTAQNQVSELERVLADHKSELGKVMKAVGSEELRPMDPPMTELLLATELPWVGESRESIPIDPFGGVYWILFDSDGDGRVRDPADQGGEAWLEREVLVFSAGPDGDPNTWKDNVRSWK